MSDELKRVVTPLQSIATQVGNNVLKTLNEAETSGVLTTIVPGFPQDHVVSIPLNTEQIKMIHSVLQAHQLALLDVHEGSVEADTERPIGFRIDPEVETDEHQSEDE
ncbi:MAG: hypothetical protein VXZ96_16110 [Myxococcota bacterium]|nr:hypothetical protein [Myxococcota bacterium]MEC8381855.1 hypothetical protein [Myxococcota bacterium]